VGTIPVDLSEVRLTPVLRSASGSSFFAAMRVLPAAQRAAVFEIYAFCRAVDDVADRDGGREPRLEELRQWRSAIDAIYAGMPPAVLRALAQAIRDFNLQREDFLAIIDGMEMDVAADIVCPDSATLDLYCDRVASAVGRLSVRVFGMPGQDGLTLAYHLGRALQLTNILRDLDEDAAKGRLYLPREALHAAGISSTNGRQVLAHPALAGPCATMVDLARKRFDDANQVLSRYPLSIARSPILMARVYQNILGRLVARGWAAPRRRVRVGRVELAWIFLRHGLF
jgi:presqualene diphosphate synthase